MKLQNVILIAVGAGAIYWLAKKAHNTQPVLKKQTVTEPVPGASELPPDANQAASKMANATGFAQPVFPANIKESFVTNMGGDTVREYQVSDVI